MPLSITASSEPPQSDFLPSMIVGPDSLTSATTTIPAIVIGPRGLERDGLVGILNQNGYSVLDSIDDIADLQIGYMPGLIILSEFGQDEIEGALVPLVQSHFPTARIVALTAETDPAVPRYLLQRGIQACLNRSAQPIALIRSLNVVMGGNIVISIGAASHLTGGSNGFPRPALMRFAKGVETAPRSGIGSLASRDRSPRLLVDRAFQQVDRPGIADLRGDGEDPRQERLEKDQCQQPDPGGGLGFETRHPDGRLPPERPGRVTRTGGAPDDGAPPVAYAPATCRTMSRRCGRSRCSMR